MQFVVEQKIGDDWHPVVHGFEAPSAERAVARGAREPGHHRVRPVDTQRYEFF